MLRVVSDNLYGWGERVSKATKCASHVRRWSKTTLINWQPPTTDKYRASR